MTTRVLTRTVVDAAIDAPMGLAVDDAGDRFAVGCVGTNRVVVGQTGTSTPASQGLGSHGTDPASEGLAIPVGVGIDGDGDCYVADTGNGEIDRYAYDAAADSYAYDAAFLGGQRDVFAGTALSEPVALAVDSGVLYVLDAGNDRVVAVDLTTGTATEPVTDGGWSYPRGLAVDGATVYVSDADAHEVVAYANGAVDARIGGYGTRDGEFVGPEGLAVGDAGQVYVVDAGNHRVQVFDASGTHQETFGTPAELGSPHAVAVDGAGTAYVSDVSRDAVCEYGTAVAGPRLVADRETLEYGRVEVGYGLDVGLTLRNVGSDPATVTDVTTADEQYATTTTGFVVAPGDEFDLRVRFSPTEASFTPSSLTVETDGAPGGSLGVTLRGWGDAPDPVSAVLVLDRSGSMRQPAGNGSKMDALHRAGDLFAELMRGGVGDRLGVVAFDDTGSAVAPLAPVTDGASGTRTAVQTAIAGISPGGSTSIGAGLERARDLFGPADDAARRVVVVVTDGMENAEPYVLPDDPADDRVDLDAFDDVTIFTVGLGLGTEVDLPVLAHLADRSNGTFHVTEDRWLLLQKFFLEIFADAVGEYVALDPTYDLVGSDSVEIPFDVDVTDGTVTAAAYWDDPSASLSVTLVTPDGTRIDPAAVRGGSGFRHASRPGYAFYRFAVPAGPALGEAHDGQWHLSVTSTLHPTERVSVGVAVIVRSGLGIRCRLRRDDDDTGLPARLEAQITEFGTPIEPDDASLRLSRPAYSRGELLADPDLSGDTDPATDRRSKSPDYGPSVADWPVGSAGRTFRPAADKYALPRVPVWRWPWHDPRPEQAGENGSPDPDYATDETREGLARALERDGRFRERTDERLDPSVVESPLGPVVRADLEPLLAEGTYEARFVVDVDRDGHTVRRECSHAFGTVAYPSRRTTEAVVVDSAQEPRIETYRVRLCPRDASGNHLGPGLADAMTVTVDDGELFERADVGEGEYEFRFGIPVEPEDAGVPDDEADFERVRGIGPRRAGFVREAGHETVGDLRAAGYARLVDLFDIGPVLAGRMVGDVSRVDPATRRISLRLRGVTLEWTLGDLLRGAARLDTAGRGSPGETSEVDPVAW